MGWLESLSSTLGAGTGGATVAVAIYAGAVALEKEMRAEARDEIAGFIKNTQVRTDIATITGFVQATFELIFGRSHWTVKCFWRSAIATYCFLFSVLLILFLKYPQYVAGAISAFTESIGKVSRSSPEGLRWIVVGVGLLILILMALTGPTAFPDYISLFKARLLLNLVGRSKKWFTIIGFIVVDAFASVLVIGTFQFLVAHFLGGLSVSQILAISLVRMRDAYVILSGANPRDPFSILALGVTLSSMMTSVWTILVFLSAGTLRLISYAAFMMRIIRWMFDVDAHPIRVLGLIAATVVWVGSVVYGVL